MMRHHLTKAVAAALTLGVWVDSSLGQTLHRVELDGFRAIKDPITIKIGDTVQWVGLNGGHSIESGVNGAHDGNFRSADAMGFNGNAYEVTFDRNFLGRHPAPGNVYPYYALGNEGIEIEGSVIVRGGTTHVVELLIYTFEPPDIEIEVGDTVRWVWVIEAKPHNVESGVAGIHDGNFRSGDPVCAPAEFELTFDQQFLDDHPMPDNLYPYYCIVHVDLAMTGTVTVLAGGCTRDPAWECDGDVDGDGQVNPVDSGLVQAAFGSAEESDLCQYDMDCDGQINPVDSGIVQSLFGTCEAPRNVCP